jgi:hypothetical protein
MDKFPANFFESAEFFYKKFEPAGKFSNIFESATKFSKFENLPVAHHIAHALRVSFQKIFTRHPPSPSWTAFSVFQKIKENDTKTKKFKNLDVVMLRDLVIRKNNKIKF